MDDYVINEKDIETAIRYLKIHDPKNADKDYAIQLLELMQGLAFDLVKNDSELAKDLFKKLKEKGNS